MNSQLVMIGLAGLAFLIALWLVVVIVRMMSGGRLRFSGGRTRQARLGIVDAFDLDRQRQLIIVRRDNTEHLIMIGGPNDLVIESEIVRVETREGRRMSDKPEGFADTRIPAPTATPDGASSAGDEPMLPLPAAAMGRPGLERPALESPPSDRPAAGRPSPERSGPSFEPMSSPVAAPSSLDPLPPRTPTFPLPRRPAPPPERRPPPPPVSATRLDEPTPPVVAPQAAPEVPAPATEQPPEAPAPAPEAEFPPPPPIPPQPLPPILPTQGSDVPPRPAIRPMPPSFLKPLPPRPPIRPLRRATPVVPGTPAVPATSAPAPVSEPVSPSVVESPAPAPAAEMPPATQVEDHSPPSPATPVEPPPAAETGARENNALESLEEEMAKLLGRG